MESINSGKDYADYIIKAVLEIEESAPEDERLPSELLKFWIEKIKEYADLTWAQYITGNRESYEFLEEEATILFDKAGYDYTATLLDGLVDKDIVRVEVGEKGDMLYGLTEEGFKIVNNLNKKL